jgi:hypothetical protein
MAPTRSSRYVRRLLGSIRKTATTFLGHHISATFELRAGVVKAEARRVERSESLDEAEHRSTLVMCDGRRSRERKQKSVSKGSAFRA